MELSCDTENWEEGGGQGGQGGRSMSWGRTRALGSDRWMRRRGRAVGTRNKQGTGDNKPEELCRMSHTLCRISRRVFLNVKLRAIFAKMSLTRRLSFVWVKRWSGKAGFWTNLGSAEVGLSRSRPEYPDGETQSSLSNPLLPQSQMLLYSFTNSISGIIWSPFNYETPPDNAFLLLQPPKYSIHTLILLDNKFYYKVTIINLK